MEVVAPWRYRRAGARVSWCCRLSTGKLQLMSMGGRAEGQACADPKARTPIGVSGNIDIQWVKIPGLRFHVIIKETLYSVFPKKCELCNKMIENPKEMKKHLISHSYKSSSQLK